MDPWSHVNPHHFSPETGTYWNPTALTSPCHPDHHAAVDPNSTDHYEVDQNSAGHYGNGHNWDDPNLDAH